MNQIPICLDPPQNKDEIGTYRHTYLNPPVIFLLTVPRQCFFVDPFVICVSCLSLSYYRVCSLQPCGRLLGRADLLALLCMTLSCVFVTLPYGVLSQVWYLNVLIPDLCLLPYFG